MDITIEISANNILFLFSFILLDKLKIVASWFSYTFKFLLELLLNIKYTPIRLMTSPFTLIVTILMLLSITSFDIVLKLEFIAQRVPPWGLPLLRVSPIAELKYKSLFDSFIKVKKFFSLGKSQCSLIKIIS